MYEVVFRKGQSPEGRSWHARLAGRAGYPLLDVIGTALVAFSMVIFAVTGSVATISFAALGLAAITFSASLPRLEEAEFSTKGARVKLSSCLPELPSGRGAGCRSRRSE